VIRALVALVVVLGACAPPPADELAVERVNTLPLNTFPPFSARVTEATIVQGLASKIRSLPPARLDVWCPFDWGLKYDLDFRHQGTRLLHGVVDAGGCRTLSLGAGDVRQTDESFWATLAGALNLYTRGSDLFPTPIPGH